MTVLTVLHYSLRSYDKLELELSPRNFRDLIRAEMEKNFSILKEDIGTIPEIPPEFISKLEISEITEDGMLLSYKIITRKLKHDHLPTLYLYFVFAYLVSN